MRCLIALVALLALCVPAAAFCDPVFQTRVLFEELGRSTDWNTTLNKFCDPKVSYQIQDVTGKLSSLYTGPTTGVPQLLSVWGNWKNLINQTIYEVELYGSPGSPRCLLYAKANFTYSGVKASENYVQVFTYELAGCKLYSIVELDDTLLLYQVLSSSKRA